MLTLGSMFYGGIFCKFFCSPIDKKIKNEAQMKLKTWLYLHRLKITELARLLGVSRCYVHQIFSGAKPSQALLDRVSVITHGNVTKFEELKEDE